MQDSEHYRGLLSLQILTVCRSIWEFFHIIQQGTLESFTHIHGRWNIKCKVPKVGIILVYSRNSQCGWNTVTPGGDYIGDELRQLTVVSGVWILYQMWEVIGSL